MISFLVDWAFCGGAGHRRDRGGLKSYQQRGVIIVALLFLNNTHLVFVTFQLKTGENHGTHEHLLVLVWQKISSKFACETNSGLS